ncbi:MAG TPA: NAD(P)-dependent oxidoreductase [Fimbriimonadaceae bacterium]|nr:NAD(P)-dependent oxidoreductase [Fimbriimonadaceae bacterium]
MPTRPRVLVTGAGGQVGTAMRSLVRWADFRTHAELDVTDPASIEAATEGKDIVVHLAAMTQVDWCELQPDRAAEINTGGTGNVIAAARMHGARVIYLSTDFVFRGDDPPYAEDDSLSPVNVYGKTKLGGEEQLDPAAGDLVVRTSWVFGQGINFLRTILGAATEGPVTVVEDQIGRPTAAADLAFALERLIRAPIAGRLHVAGDGAPCSWADLAELALQYAGRSTEVIRVDTESFRASHPERVAPRPPNSTLSIDKARDLDIPLVDWRASLQRYVEELV